MNFLFVLSKRRPALWRAFLAGVVAYLLFVYLGPQEYRAIGIVQGFSSTAATTATGTPTPAQTDLGADSALMSSSDLVNRVAARLTDAEKQSLQSRPWFGMSSKSPVEILEEGREVTPKPDSKVIEVSFLHSNPDIAARVASLYAEEFVKLRAETKQKNIEKVLGQLQGQANEAQQNVTDVQAQINTLVDKYDASNLQSGSDSIYVTAIQELEKITAQKKYILDDASGKWQAVQAQQLAGKPMWELTFIASQPRIAALIKQYADHQANLTILMNENYPDFSPEVKTVKGWLETSATELGNMADYAANITQSDYQAAQFNYDQSMQRLKDKKQEAQDMSKVRTVYDSLRSQRDTAQNLYQSQMMALQQQESALKLSIPDYSAMAPQTPHNPERPSSWHMVTSSLTFGLSGSLLMAAGLMVFYPASSEELDEFKRRRRRHRHFSSDRHKSSSSKSSSSRHRR